MSRDRLAQKDKSEVQKSGSKQRASDLLAQKLKASADKKKERFTDFDSNPMFREAAQSVGDFRSLSYSNELDYSKSGNRAGAMTAQTVVETSESTKLKHSISSDASNATNEPDQNAYTQKYSDVLQSKNVESNNENTHLSDVLQEVSGVGIDLSNTPKSAESSADLNEIKGIAVASHELALENDLDNSSLKLRSSKRSALHSGRAASLLKPSWETDFSKETFEVFKIVQNITGPRYSYLASGYCALYEKARASGSITLHLNRILLSEILGTHSSGTVTRFLKKGVEFGLFVSQSFTVKSAVTQSGTYVHLLFPWK